MPLALSSHFSEDTGCKEEKQTCDTFRKNERGPEMVALMQCPAGECSSAGEHRLEAAKHQEPWNLAVPSQLSCLYVLISSRSSLSPGQLASHSMHLSQNAVPMFAGFSFFSFPPRFEPPTSSDL